MLPCDSANAYLMTLWGAGGPVDRRQRELSGLRRAEVLAPVRGQGLAFLFQRLQFGGGEAGRVRRAQRTFCSTSSRPNMPITAIATPS